jgi:Protein of unknown function (DUF3037)
MNRFTYSVVQITPKLSAGESVNVAVIVGNDQLGDWAIRRIQDENRARRFCGINAMVAATEFLEDIEERIDVMSDRNTEEWLGESLDEVTLPISEQLIDEFSNLRRGVVHLSTPTPVLADSAEDALELLGPDFLVEPVPRVFKRLTKGRVVSDLRTAYELAGISSQNLRREPVLHVGDARQFHFKSDFAIATDRVLQICNAWSFQIADLDRLARNVEAWGFNMRALRDHGGVTGDGQIEIPPKVDVQVIIAPDPTREGQQAQSAAELVFREVRASVVPYDERERVAEYALKLVG